MVYIITRPRGAVRGQHGAMTREPVQLRQEDPKSFPHPDEVENAILASRADPSRARRKSTIKYIVQPRASIFDVSSAVNSPLLADLKDFVSVEPSTPTSGSVEAPKSKPSNAPTKSGTSPTDRSLAVPGTGQLRLSQFLNSSASINVTQPYQRHSATTASPLAPVLVNGVDVQACLFHVGVQKKWFYEETLANLQHMALGIIPAELKAELTRRFPNVTKTGVGIFGAIVAVSRSRPSVAPLPSQGAKAVAELHSIAQDTAGGRHHQRQQSQQRLRTSQPRDPATSAQGRRRASEDLMGTSVRSRNDSATPDAWTPAMIIRELQMRKATGVTVAADGNVYGSDATVLARLDSAGFSNFERAAEDFLAGLDPAQAQQLLDVPMASSGDELSMSEPDDKLQALQQQLLIRRVDHVKNQERKHRTTLVKAFEDSVPAHFTDLVDGVRRAILMTERSAMARLLAQENAEALQLALRGRVQRRAVLSSAVSQVAAVQERELRQETADRISAIEAEGLAAVRAVQREFAYADGRIRASIRQEREARLREVLAHRKGNPTDYFPSYTDAEVGASSPLAFVPMRIAVGEERTRQQQLRERERQNREATQKQVDNELISAAPTANDPS